MKILILDDETSRASLWKTKLEDFGLDLKVTAADTGFVSDVISDLHRIRLEARESQAKIEPYDRLSEYDVVILDYDLLGLNTQRNSAWSTGAEIAYAARLLADVGPMLLVNQYGTDSFDLTMRKAISSYADYDVGHKQLITKNLFVSSGFSGFRPWSWPNLSLEGNRLKRMADYVLQRLDEPVLSSLGFESSDFDSPRFLRREIVGVLGVSEHTTFRDLVMNRHCAGVFNILEKDDGVLSSLVDMQIARISSVVVWHWLERVVLPAQDTLCDLPHLVYFLPWLLGDDVTSEDVWGHQCSIERKMDQVGDYAFEPECFFSRPVYWLKDVRERTSIPAGFSISNVPRLVFCEDASRFVQEDDALDFYPDVFAADALRWISGDEDRHEFGVNYEPQGYLMG